MKLQWYKIHVQITLINSSFPYYFDKQFFIKSFDSQVVHVKAHS